MRKTYGIVDWVGLGPLRSSVVLIVGDDLEMLRDWLAHNREIVNPNLTDQDINDIIVTIDEDGAAGCCFDMHGNYCIYLEKWDEQVFLHEAYHAVRRKLENSKIYDTNGEVGARLIEFLWMTFVKEAGDREKKGIRQIMRGAKED